MESELRTNGGTFSIPYFFKFKLITIFNCECSYDDKVSIYEEQFRNDVIDEN